MARRPSVPPRDMRKEGGGGREEHGKISDFATLAREDVSGNMITYRTSCRQNRRSNNFLLSMGYDRMSLSRGTTINESRSPHHAVSARGHIQHPPIFELDNFFFPKQ